MEAIKESLTDMNTIFNKKLAEFEERQQKLNAPASPSQRSLENEFAVFKTFIMNALRTLQSQVELLAVQTDKLEMYNRRNILLLHGVSEDKKEDTVAIVVKLVSQSLKLSDFEAKHVSRCHRMGKSSSSSDRKRPILFKVKDESFRSKIWAAKTNLKGSGITLSEFLTKTRYDTFMAARDRFGVTKCWSQDGLVFVMGANGARHRISCLADLDKIEEPLKTKPLTDGAPPAAEGSAKPPSSSEKTKYVPKPKLKK